MKNLAAIYRWLPPAMFLAFLPIAAALLQGQDSILLLTLLAAALVSLLSGRELAAGVLVGLGLFKFQIVIPIALLYLIWRRWRFVFGFASLALAETVASIWLVGTSQFITYARSLITMGAGLHEVTKPVANLMANLHGLVFRADGRKSPRLLDCGCHCNFVGHCSTTCSVFPPNGRAQR